MDASVEQLLGEAEEAGSFPTTVVQSLTLCTNSPPLVPCRIVSCKAGVQPSNADCVYGSPKSEKAVSRAFARQVNPVFQCLEARTSWSTLAVCNHDSNREESHQDQVLFSTLAVHTYISHADTMLIMNLLTAYLGCWRPDHNDHTRVVSSVVLAEVWAGAPPL